MSWFNIFGNQQLYPSQCQHTFEIIDATILNTVHTVHNFGEEHQSLNKTETVLINRCSICGEIKMVNIPGIANNILNKLECNNKDIKNEQ